VEKTQTRHEEKQINWEIVGRMPSTLRYGREAVGGGKLWNPKCPEGNLFSVGERLRTSQIISPVPERYLPGGGKKKKEQETR